MPKCVCSLLILLTVGIAYSHAGFSSPESLTADWKLRKVMLKADRIVVRDGGMNCCRPVDNNPVFFEVTDPEEIKTFIENMKICGYGDPQGCECCGWPGIDFYKDGKRIALTSVKDGAGIWWKKSEAELTEGAQKWLREWLVKNGVSEDILKKNHYPTPKK